MFMGPDPLTFGTDPSRTHVGAHLRRERTDAKIGAEQLAQADGTWEAADVLQLEQQRTIGPDDWVRWHDALRLAVRYLREQQP